MVGLDDLRGLFQPTILWFYDFIMLGWWLVLMILEDFSNLRFYDFIMLGSGAELRFQAWSLISGGVAYCWWVVNIPCPSGCRGDHGEQAPLTWRALKNKSAMPSSLLFILPSIIQTQERINSIDLKEKKHPEFVCAWWCCQTFWLGSPAPAQLGTTDSPARLLIFGRTFSSPDRLSPKACQTVSPDNSHILEKKQPV